MAKTVKKIFCVGAGYVGGPTMCTIAKMCPDIEVYVFDIAQPRIDAWNSPKEKNGLPIYEPGLAEIVYEVRGRNLFFTTDPSEMKTADVIFVSVNTPTKERGIGAGRAADLTYIESCGRLIGKTVLGGNVVVVEKSTVPIRCSVALHKIITSSTSGNATFTIVSNPEFLAEGTAINDLKNPDRVLIGGQCNDAVALVSSIYERWVEKSRIITTGLWSSELSKLVANAFLAQRISSINSITPLCEVTGADVEDVSHAIGADPRIGPHFLCPSVGFGGSCFKKDILNLVYLLENFSLHESATYWEQVVLMNEYQKNRFYKRIVSSCFGSTRGKTISILGFAFKKDTGDTREGAAIYVCGMLLEEGSHLSIYDPKVSKEAIFMELEMFIDQKGICDPNVKNTSGGGGGTRKFLEERVHVKSSATEACQGAHAVVVLTDWDEFRTMDYQPIYNQIPKPAVLFDGRNVVDKEKLTAIGFEVFSIGKPLSHEVTEAAATSQSL